MRKLVVLVALAMVAVVGFEALYVSDADARNRRPPAPPNYNFVLCSADQNPCNGTSSADLMVGAAGDEVLKGAGGKDIYMGSAGNSDAYFDQSTSSDLYGGFVNDQFEAEFMGDGGGLDRIDLRPYASTDFEFIREDRDGDGAFDDLHMNESTLGGGDDLFVDNHFTGSGRIESITFTDKTLSGANLPLTP